MERLTKWEDDSITYNEKREFECGEYCDSCSQGAGNCKTVENMIKKLATYEDLEEHGLLVRLPCKVGDTVYKITRFCSGGIRDCGYSYECSECPEYKPFIEYIEFKITILKDIGKNVFLTREEAEKKLEEMKNDL